ncbi:aldo/keto reductase [Bradyrhizobium rifense]|uniref:Aldo/keto reductase n=1 Tax=Bradyrhizobium rifense TaxID=515499 RepID=A0A5D3KHC2_9BRAD|nr:aldo/keto reductase [Bradyrhizobium rifense]TYL96123.1 aldo/keto reductase [Bradyrhizobium rifense]
MHKVRLPGSAAEVCRIGLGGGGLIGGANLRQSIAVFEAAYEAGIRYIDVAPLYGLAEDVVGNLVQSYRGDFILATKVGIARPKLPGLFSLLRKTLRPIALRLPTVKQFALRQAQALVTTGLFHPDQVRSSLEDSLRRLKTEWVDVLLLHEPRTGDMTPELLGELDRLISSQQVRLLGTGTQQPAEQSIRYGDVWQHRYAPGDALPVNYSGLRVLHGVLRYGLPLVQTAIATRPATASALSNRYGYDFFDPDAHPAILATLALAADPRSVLLLSSRHPIRIGRCVSQINWSIARGDSPDYVDNVNGLLTGHGAAEAPTR